MANPLLDRILLNENAYFFSKSTNAFYTNTHIHQLFVDVSTRKSGNYLLNERKQSKEIRGISFEYSICVFKFITIPSFIDRPIPNWEEEKIAYLLILDFKDYVFISKKSIFSSEDLLLKDLTPIDYTVLATLFVDDSTNFEKFTLNNTSASYDAIKGKTLEANDLKKSFSGFGAGKYVLSSLRLSNKEEKTAVSLNTSRITNYGEKKYINDLFSWATYIINKIKNHVQKNSFLNIFATPIDYEANRTSLIPISLLFSLARFNTDIEDNEIVACEYFINDETKRSIPLKYILQDLKNVFDIMHKVVAGQNVYYINSKFINDVVLNINRKSITLASNKAKNIILTFDNGTTESILSYFNRHNDYIINFSDLSLVYTNRKLFKDNKLIGYIDNFIDIFIGKPELALTTTEKGDFATTSIFFTPNSIFEYVDNTLSPASDYSFLDDLGDEWADFITLHDNKITLVHAKHEGTQLSASSFHEIVGQALKNIGNFSPSDERVGITKKRKWRKKYKINNVTTNIDRLRKGANINSAIKAYQKILLSANVRKEIILAIDFVSKSQLQDRLLKLKNDVPFTERNQVIQLLWIVSSLINSCAENGIEIRVHCKP